DGTLVGTSCDDGDPNTINDVFLADCSCIGQPPAGTGEYWLEAECAEYGNQWTTIDASEVSGGINLASLATEEFLNQPPSGEEYRIRFTVEVAVGGVYAIFGRVLATNDGDDSFWVSANGGFWNKWNRVNFPYNSTDWVWEQVGHWTNGDVSDPVTFTLQTGTNIIDFVHREPNTKLDKILLRAVSDPPVGLGAAAINCDLGCDGLPGDSCNDGNVCTTNDALDANCNCVGTVQDSDNDTVCDAEDQCPGFDDRLDDDEDGIPNDCDNCVGSPGNACNDGDACTINDALNADCNCVGVLQDSDNDTVCDGLDQCPGFDDRLDEDGDGTPDDCDSCNGNLAGTPCDDGNPATQFDALTQDCNCVGQAQPTSNEYWLEAECAIIGMNWRVQDTLPASQNALVKSDLTFSFPDGAPVVEDYYIRFPVHVAEEGGYAIFARVAVMDSTSDALWVRVNNGSWMNWNQINYPYNTNGLQWQQVGNWMGGEQSVPVAFSLQAGQNTIDFSYHEPGVQLDKILVSPLPIMPEAFGDFADNCLPSSTEEYDTSVGLLYPNPTTGAIQLSNLPQPIKGLTLLDAYGRILRQYADTPEVSHQLDLSFLPAGWYVLRAEMDGRMVHWRLLKK
ncbi:MAG: T9SS type A sorting domain-containing protein, partial [Bacteroidota bacterium]